MMILRDKQLPEQEAQKILDLLCVEGRMLTWDKGQDPIYGSPPEHVLFITAAEHGWLGYHQEYFSAHRNDVAQWFVIVLNTNPVSVEQVRMGFDATNAVVHLYANSAACSDYWKDVGKQLAMAARIKERKALIYSIHPGCGKRTIAGLLARHLPDWQFETADETGPVDTLCTTDAAQIIIVGKRLEELAVDLPEGRKPYFVLTMADQNIQTFLQPAVLPGLLQQLLPEHLRWTREKVSSRFYFACPLYETWHEDQADPRLDERFIMWDSYGLPIVHQHCDMETIQRFISQFDQCSQLARALAP